MTKETLKVIRFGLAWKLTVTFSLTSGFQPTGAYWAERAKAKRMRRGSSLACR